MKTPQVAVKLSNLSKRYGSTLALDDINVEVPAGTVVGLVGSNGSGKSTLLRLIAGVERPSHGEIEFFGTNLASSETIGSGTGAAIDAMALWPRWSVKRTLTYLGQLTGRTDEEVKDVIKSLSLGEYSSRKVRTLSLGNRQRVQIGAALINGSLLTILDEPMNGLDPQGRLLMRNLIEQLPTDERTVLISSHDLNEIQTLCSHIIHLERGRMIFAGELASYVGEAKSFLVHYPPELSEAISSIIDHRLVRTGSHNPGVLEVDDQNVETLRTLMEEHSIPVLNLETKKHTLEDQFHAHGRP